MPTYRIDEFSGGRDKRPRVFYGHEKNRWKNLDNAYIGKDRKVHRRKPLRFARGTVNTASTTIFGTTPSFGAISINGTLTYFASKANAATNSVSIPGVATALLTFDELPNHSAIGVIDARLFAGSVVALIAHRSLGAQTATTYKLHVFDGLANKPTYIEDPYFPTSWGPTRPLHLYRKGTLGAAVAYTPRMGIAAGKLYVSGPDNNTYFSAPNNARVWNTLTPVQLQNQGEWFYWDNYDTYVPGVLVDTTTRWIVSEDFTKLSTENGWTCYVLEYCDTTGTWQKFIEDTALPTVQGHYRPISLASRFVGGPNEIAFQFIAPTGASPIIRFRLIAGSPPITVVSGGVWSSNVARTQAQGTYEGVAFQSLAVVGIAPATTNFARLLLLSAPVSNLAGAQVFDNGGAAGTNSDVSLAFSKMTGLQRYQNLILGFDYSNDNGFGTVAVNHSYTSYAAASIGNTIGYGWQTGNASQFFADRTAYETGIAGNGLAGFLPTATRARVDGGPVTALSTIKDFLAVHYRTMTLLYAVNPNQLLDALRDTSAFGTGLHTDGIVTQFYHQTIVFSERGFRAFYVAGLNSDRADDTNIGEPNEAFDPANTTLLNAVFWPYTGQYIALLKIIDSTGTNYWLYVFDYSKDSKISAWSRWQIGVTPAVAGSIGLVVIGPRVYVILSSGGVAYLDGTAAAGQFFDDLDLTGAPNPYAYVSTAESYQNDFGRMSTNKQITSMDAVVMGVTTVSFNLLNQNVEKNIPGTVIKGITKGDKVIRLGMRGFSVGTKFTSTDPAGWVLDSYSIDFVELQR